MKRATMLLCMGMWIAGTAVDVARAQDATPTAKQRWQELTPEERRALEERFQKLQQLTPEERRALKNRHDVLQRLRHDEAVEEQGVGARQPQKPPRARMNDGIFKKLEKLEQQGTGPRREEFRARVRERVEDELLRMEEAGVLVPGEAERLLVLPPQELATALRVKLKEFFFRNPPAQFSRLPDDERKRLEGLPPEEFGPEIRRVLGPPDGPRGPDAARGPQGPRQGDGIPPPRPFVPKEALYRFLTPQQRAEVEALDPKERRARVMRLLVDHARARLAERGEDPRVLDGLKGLPQHERQMRVLKILDPNFTPPPRPDRFKRPGQAPPRGTREV